MPSLSQNEDQVFEGNMEDVSPRLHDVFIALVPPGEGGLLSHRCVVLGSSP